ncbi:hypothetical protein PXD04_09300 [Methanosphaera sp. ISO3-F5]|uniref:hypothetical protein n=1 Tax=Methanosphaera sp. ISO3-F5 TaxID=1452353 RepID=UPI002B25BF47|nr:hypothetical protein [Methanosphaera sp. ISO3-F5]WQH63884.1 hypothetical protein PXD04_09300 [Methanosphaera sp. ISO3-F5]
MNLRLLLLLVLSLMIIPVSCAEEVRYDDFSYDVEFMPTAFVFDYNDHNTSTYEGDIGLKYAYANSSFDNHTYIIPTERVRGIAYATKGSFKFTEPILIDHGPYRDWDDKYVITGLKFKNGTEIPYLGIESTGLTKEQMSYFDNYYEQRQDYLAQQEAYAAEDLYDYETSKSRSSSGRSKFGYYVGTGGSGVIYNP